MNWIRENKFLAVFLGFVFVVAGGLIFLLIQAMGQYGEVNDAYNNQVTQLKNLQAQAPYPNSANLATYTAQKAALNDEIAKLQTNLGKYEFPVEPLTPEQFQDQLRATVNTVAERAKQLGVKIPEKFALGFERYLTEPPNKEAAPQLGRELKAVEFIVNELLDSHVESISEIDRAPLPEENNQKPPKALLFKHPITVHFTSEQNRFRRALNEIVSTPKQFYIARLVEVKNQVDKSPSKASATAGGPAPVISGTGNNLNKLSFIFGTEKLDVTLKIEIVDFAAATPAK